MVHLCGYGCLIQNVYSMKYYFHFILCLLYVFFFKIVSKQNFNIELIGGLYFEDAALYDGSEALPLWADRHT